MPQRTRSTGEFVRTMEGTDTATTNTSASDAEAADAQPMGREERQPADACAIHPKSVQCSFNERARGPFVSTTKRISPTAMMSRPYREGFGTSCIPDSARRLRRQLRPDRTVQR